MKPPRTEAELRALQRQSRTAFVAVYAITAASSLLFGILVLTVSRDNLTEIGRYLGWALMITGTIAMAMFQVARRRFDRYLSDLYAADAAGRSEA